MSQASSDNPRNSAASPYSATNRPQFSASSPSLRQREYASHPSMTRMDTGGYPPMSDNVHQTSGSSIFTIRDMLRILRRGWWLPALGGAIGLTLAVFYVSLQPISYKSSARILVDRSTNRFLQSYKIIDQPTFDYAELESQVHVLSSDSIVVPVIRALNLANDPEFIGPPTARGPWVLWRINEAINDVRRYVLGGERFVVTDAMRERIAVDAFLRRLAVYRVDVANVISVTFDSDNPEKAATIANAIAEAYLASTVEAKSKSTQLANKWLEDRLNELKVQAIEADRALQDYKIVNDLVTSGKDQLNAEQLSALNAQLNNARMAMVEVKARFERLQKTLDAGVPTPPVADTINSGVITKLRAQYFDLASKASEIGSNVGPNHGAVVRIQERMAELASAIQAEERRIAGSYSSEYQILKARESEIAATIAKLTGEAQVKSQAQVTMRDFESSADTFRQLHSAFLQKLQEMSASQTQAIGVQDARIVTRAAPPLYRSATRSRVVLAGGLAAGLLLGFGIAVAREWTANVFKSPHDVEDFTGLKCVMLPLVDVNRDRQNAHMEEVVLDQPYSRFTEGVRGIRAHIGAVQAVREVKVIGVVSSVPREGKSIVASNLAALTVAASGKRTLLIDSDLHLRHLTNRLASDAQEGLIEALIDPSRLPMLVTKKDRSGLEILPCVLSERLPNAAEVLGSSQMEQLLLAARQSYDCIVIDIAPVMSVIDIKTIERFIDGFVFVIEWGSTKRSLLQEALSEAELINDRLICAVLNKADPRELRSLEVYKGNRFKDYYVG